MKVTLAQHGGQAAVINLHLRPWVVDTATLKPADAAELMRLMPLRVHDADYPKLRH
jgi:hypothetical protein